MIRFLRITDGPLETFLENGGQGRRRKFGLNFVIRTVTATDGEQFSLHTGAEPKSLNIQANATLRSHGYR